MNRDSSDSIVSRLRAGWPGFDSRTHPVSCLVDTVVKRPVREGDHSFSPGAEAKNSLSYTSTPHIPW